MIAKSTSAFTLTLPSDREIAMTRVFDAPRSLVFEAWTKPEHVRHWWGCDGSTLTVCEIDLRPGGVWRFVLRMPDGSDHPFKGVYREIVRPERLVYTECYDEPSIGSPEWLTTVIFEEQGGKTKLTSTCLHASVEARDGHLNAGMEAGAAQTFDRLAEHLKSMA
jgi:uncharacterized protein YndB with AHSA1/START domain